MYYMYSICTCTCTYTVHVHACAMLKIVSVCHARSEVSGNLIR